MTVAVLFDLAHGVDARARGVGRPGDVEHVTGAGLARAAAVLVVHVDVDDAPAFAQEVAELVRTAPGPADGRRVPVAALLDARARGVGRPGDVEHVTDAGLARAAAVLASFGESLHLVLTTTDVA